MADQNSFRNQTKTLLFEGVFFLWDTIPMTERFRKGLILSGFIGISLLLSVWYMPPFIVHKTDEFDYLSSIILGKESTVQMGKVVFIGMYHSYFIILKTLFHIPPLEMYKFLKLVTVVFSVSTITLWYLIVKKQFHQVLIPIIAILTLLINHTYLLYSGSVMTDVPMAFLLILGIYLLFTARDTHQQRYFLLSAVVVGLGFHIKEQMIFFFPWILLLFIVQKKSQKQILAYFLIALSGVIFPIIYVFDRGGELYFDRIRDNFQNSTHAFSQFSMQYRIESFVSSIPMLIGIFCILGAVCAVVNIRRERGLKFLIEALLLFLIPILLSIFYVYPEQRNYIPLWFPLGVFFAYGIRMVGKNLSNLFPLDRSIVIILECMLVAGYAGNEIYTRYQNFVIPQHQESAAFHQYSNLLLTHFSGPAVFLVGEKTWLIQNYLTPLVRHDWEVIPSGWGWAGVDGVTEKIDYYLADRIPVYVDRESYQTVEYTDMQEVIQKYTTTADFDPFIRIEERK